MTPVYCDECGRANGQSARRCIWCGTPMVEAGTPSSFETTRTEIDYLEGIDRLADPGPVKLSIGPEGIEVTELMPGSRTVRIAAGSIIRADAIDASTTGPPAKKRLSLWRTLITPFSWDGWKAEPSEAMAYDYLLAVRYTEGEEIRNAVFHRQDRAGRAMVEGLARIINMLVKLSRRAGQAE